MRRFTKILFAGAILIAIFGASFFFFYKRAQQVQAKQPLILTPAVLNQPLPPASLVNLAGQVLDDDKLRHGKVILVFSLSECEPCDQENAFLKTAAANNKNVRFYDVIPFGQKEQALQTAQSKYAFETYFDDHSMLSRSLQIYQVPVKIFVEDGIIRKVWLDATTEPAAQTAFKQWLYAL